jgi:DNA processing protein
MSPLELCVWLNGCECLSARILHNVENETVPDSVIQKLLKLELMKQPTAVKLQKLALENWTQREIQRAETAGIFLISWYDKQYPERLREIKDPPLVLYVKGNLPDFTDSYAVVGTRRCTPYGFKISELTGAALAKADKVVVSGGARGIDGAAHGGVLSQNGVTVAVLGTGVDLVWPPEHDDLFASILKKGALISEYPLGAPGVPWHFPKRNRLIAGLTKGIIVVESPFKGGAMITARLAMEMGREIWAVPGRIDEKVCEGTNRLILDGATPLINIGDFIDAISTLGQLSLFTPLNLDAEQRKIVDCLQNEGGLTADQIAARTGIDSIKLVRLLTELQIQTLIYSSGGGRWRAMPR